MRFKTNRIVFDLFYTDVQKRIAICLSYTFVSERKHLHKDEN